MAATARTAEKTDTADNTRRDSLYVMTNDTLYTLPNDSVCPIENDMAKYDYVFLTAMAKYNAGDDEAATLLLDSCRPCF